MWDKKYMDITCTLFPDPPPFPIHLFHLPAPANTTCHCASPSPVPPSPVPPSPEPTPPEPPAPAHVPHNGKRKKIIRRTIAVVLIVPFIILLTFLTTRAVLQPKKPHFIIQDATLYAFDVTSVPSNLLTPKFQITSNFQITISSRNPDSKIGIYYDKLDIYVTYRNQQITNHTAIPPTYQGQKDVNVWSPFVWGTNVPVAPSIGVALCQDQANGNYIRLMIKITGRVRWKVGSVTMGRYHIHVTCPAYIPFGNPNTGITVGGAIKYQLAMNCKVSV